MRDEQPDDIIQWEPPALPRSTRRLSKKEQILLDALHIMRNGCSFRTACRVAGIDPDKARTAVRKRPAFQSVVMALESRPVSMVENALFESAVTPDQQGKTNFQAQRLFLLNRAPEEWSDNSKMDLSLSVDVTAPIRDVSEDGKADLRLAAKKEIYRLSGKAPSAAVEDVDG